MKTKFSGILTLLLALVVQMTFAQVEQQTVSGTVTDDSGLPLPGVNVLVRGTNRGVQTDFDGNYAIEASEGEVLVFSYLGMRTVEVIFQDSPRIDVILEPDAAQLDEVVVTALGIRREEKSLPYASQTVNAEELNITEGVNIKSAVAGKVAGVQINAQAGSKLGEAGRIRIRGGISLTSDDDPLYVIDGVPTNDPNSIDMSNVATLNVLKGPNATALYGQRASNGVVQITTKRGAETDRIGIEITSSVTFDRVGNMMNYQNLYGQGYSPNEFGTFDFESGYNFRVFGISGGPYPDWMQVFDGQRYFNRNVYADESWGPRFDGEPYIPWYAMYRDSPYFGQTDTWEAHPDNIRDFYDTGTTFKNIIALSGGGENYSARLSYTNLQQTGVIPNSSLDRNFITSSFDFNLTDNFSIGTNINYTVGAMAGDVLDDQYGNQTTGQFNSWFGRNIDTDKLRELQGLTTEEGFLASWNNWGLDAWAAGEDLGILDFKKPAFWFNPYDWLELYNIRRETTTLLGDVHASYSFLDMFEATVQISRNERKYRRDFEVPYIIEYSAAPGLYNEWVNSFGRDYRSTTEDNFQGLLRFEQDFENFDVSAMIGGNIRRDDFYRFVNDMSQTNSDNGGLILPDVYTYSNSREQLTATATDREKQVNSIFGNVSLGFRDLLYIDASIRRDWSSALPPNNNGYTYPAIGGSLLFSEFITDNDILTFGKLRGGWAQVGDDVDAHALNPTYPLGSQLYNDRILQYDVTRLVDPNVQPAMNTSYEVGIDLRFFQNRMGFQGTYYNETRENEIIPITISSASGYLDYLTNAGESHREGIELALDVDIVNTEDFRWNILANWATNESTIVSLPAGLDAIEGAGGSDNWGFVTVVHRVGQEWGQLRGTGFVYDDNGNRVIRENGTYAYETDKYFGSILPDFTGGFVNTMSYKNLTLMASFDYQKGGKFFSLSEMWGGYSGLTAETAEINDNGVNVRDPLDEGGGVHVTGVYEDGSPADTYVNAMSYWGQFQPNRIAEPFIHEADYFKLRDVSLTYRLSGSVVNNVFDSASISVIGRNLWLIAVADDNVHRWDPSEMSQSFGENAQLPSTRSFGMNVKLTF